MQIDLNLLAEEENLLQLGNQDMQHIHIINVNIWLDEIDPDELMNEDDMHEEDGNNDRAVNIDDINLDELVGPGEEGFPDVQHILNEQVNEQAGQIPAEQKDPELPENQVHHLNVGLALIHAHEADPVWMERYRTAEATRLWANFFAKGNAESLHISIPSQWANFFTVMLLSPDLFGWAKDFLASKVVTCLGREAGVIDYHVPKQCPK